MKYKVIVTLGPKSQSESIWEELISAGADSFRLNTSHLSLQELKSWLEKLHNFYLDKNIRLPVILDLQGSKWRLGDFPSFQLFNGQVVKLIYALDTDNTGELPVPHRDFFEAAKFSEKEIVLNDAKIVLSLQSVDKESVIAQVEKGGEISSRKGITFSLSNYRKETLNEKDLAILHSSRQFEFVQFAVSYVKDSSEMLLYRKHIGRSAYIIAKLERASAVNDAAEISKYSNELWLCRGDLGAELGLQALAPAVNSISQKISVFGIPVIMAGQVLEHMTEHLSPTRSEVCYIYDSLLKGYSGFVLSDECAVGKYPVESCRIASMFR